MKTYRNTIPVLINHHDTQKHTKSEEENAVNVMFDSVADVDGKCEQEDLGDGEENGAKDDITEWPSVIQGAEYKNELRHHIDDSANKWPQDIDDP